jgi:hypothetical protein
MPSTRTLGPPGPGRPASTRSTEDVLEVDTAAGIATRSRAVLHLVEIVAELVVKLALFLIAENLIRLVDLFELGLSALVVRVDIGVMLTRQLAIGLFDFLLVGLAINTQDFVKVFGHLRFQLTGMKGMVVSALAFVRRVLATRFSTANLFFYPVHPC